MKRLLLLCFISIGVVSCKSEGEKVDGPELLGSFYAIVNGNNFEGLDNKGLLTSDKLYISGAKLRGTAEESSIQFEIPKYKGVGTYEINSDTWANFKDSSVLYTARSGKIVVTAASDGSAKGTFTFMTEGNGKAHHVSAGLFQFYK